MMSLTNIIDKRYYECIMAWKSVTETCDVTKPPYFLWAAD